MKEWLAEGGCNTQQLDLEYRSDMCGRISVHMRHLLTLWDLVVFIAMYAVECGEGMKA